MLKTEQLYFASYRVLGLNERLMIFHEVVKSDLECVKDAADCLIEMLATNIAVQ